MTGCGRSIRYMLEGITYYTPCTSHDHDGRCQGLITDWMTQPI